MYDTKKDCTVIARYAVNLGKSWSRRRKPPMRGGGLMPFSIDEPSAKATARSFRVTLTRAEAGALLSAAEAGTRDDAIRLGWTEAKKAAYLRARKRVTDAMRGEV